MDASAAAIDFLESAEKESDHYLRSKSESAKLQGPGATDAEPIVSSASSRTSIKYWPWILRLNCKKFFVEIGFELNPTHTKSTTYGRSFVYVIDYLLIDIE